MCTSSLMVLVFIELGVLILDSPMLIIIILFYFFLLISILLYNGLVASFHFFLINLVFSYVHLAITCSPLIPCVCRIALQSFSFYLSVSSCWSEFLTGSMLDILFIHSANLCILIGEFSLFTFNVIIEGYRLLLYFCCSSNCFECCYFLQFVFMFSVLLNWQVWFILKYSFCMYSFIIFIFTLYQNGN